MAAAPGSDRLYVAERPGRIYSFPNDRRADKARRTEEYLNRYFNANPTEEDDAPR